MIPRQIMCSGSVLILLYFLLDPAPYLFADTIPLKGIFFQDVEEGRVSLLISFLSCFK